MISYLAVEPFLTSAIGESSNCGIFHSPWKIFPVFTSLMTQKSSCPDEINDKVLPQLAQKTGISIHKSISTMNFSHLYPYNSILAHILHLFVIRGDVSEKYFGHSVAGNASPIMRRAQTSSMR